MLPSAWPTPAAECRLTKRGVARRLRIAVGHADHARFLQAEHVVDVVGPVREERQFGRAGIAEDFFDAERAQQVEGRLLDGDRPRCVFGLPSTPNVTSA